MEPIEQCFCAEIYVDGLYVGIWWQATRLVSLNGKVIDVRVDDLGQLGGFLYLLLAGPSESLGEFLDRLSLTVRVVSKTSRGSETSF